MKVIPNAKKVKRKKVNSASNVQNGILKQEGRLENQKRFSKCLPQKYGDRVYRTQRLSFRV